MKIRITSVDSDPYLVVDGAADTVTVGAEGVQDVAVVAEVAIIDTDGFQTKYTGQAVLVVTQKVAHKLGHMYLHGAQE